MGLSGAAVVRLRRGKEHAYWKSGPGVDEDVERLLWLGTTDVACPRVLDRGDGWALTSELPGRDVARPWPAADRPAVLAAVVEGLRALHALDVRSCPFVSPFPGPAKAVTHGDFALPNVFVDPSTLRFAGVLDLGRLGAGDPYLDLALVYKSLAGELNPQYGGPPAAREVVLSYGGDPGDPRIAQYIDLDNSGTILP